MTTLMADNRQRRDPIDNFAYYLSTMRSDTPSLKILFYMDVYRIHQIHDPLFVLKSSHAMLAYISVLDSIWDKKTVTYEHPSNRLQMSILASRDKLQRSVQVGRFRLCRIQ